jgi:hypothetical protein
MSTNKTTPASSRIKATQRPSWQSRTGPCQPQSPPGFTSAATLLAKFLANVPATTAENTNKIGTMANATMYPPQQQNTPTK